MNRFVGLDRLGAVPALAGSLALLAACQTTGVPQPDPTSTAITFERPSYTPPARTVDDLVRLFRRPDRPSGRCSEQSRSQREEPASALAADFAPSEHALWSDVARLRFQLELELARGNYRTGTELARAAIAAFAGQRIAGDFWAELARFEASVGRVDAARSAYAQARQAWGTDRSSARAAYVGGLTTADIAFAAGEVDHAEQLYHGTIETVATRPLSNEFTAHGTWKDPIDFERIYLGLASVALSRGQVAEAERWARKAVRTIYVTARYSSKTADALLYLAEVLLQQGRIEDALALVAVALDMHDYVCADPSLLSLARTHALSAQIKVARDDWAGALTAFSRVEESLRGEPETLERLYGADFEWGLALVKVGRAEEAATRVSRALVLIERRYGTDSYELAEATGLLAMALEGSGRGDAATSSFERAVPRLIEGEGAANGGHRTSPARETRLRLILESYLSLLLTRWQQVDAVSTRTELVERMFLVADAARGQRVNNAVAAAAARGAAGDPELAELARRVQDVGQSMTIVSETLRDLDLVPEDQVDDRARKELHARLGALRDGQRALLEELRTRFPDYEQIVRPRPISIGDARTLLRDGETLLATYSLDSQTLVWALPRTGEVVFARTPIGKAALGETVRMLREALDPDEVRTLADIPAFDVALSRGLYDQLLQPVESGWSGARALVVVGHDALGQLPFGVLAQSGEIAAGDGAADSPRFARYRRVHWLAREIAIARLPSVSALEALRSADRPAAPRKPYAGFGDPWFGVAAAPSDTTTRGALALRDGARDGELTRRRAPTTSRSASASLRDLPALPDTAEEIRAQARSLGADPHTSIFLGKSASEAVVKSMDLRDRRIVAFATHGLVAGDLDGLTQPALALSSPAVTGESEDGLLTMEEIFGLELGADWIVLSACNTGAADGRGAEAVSGLGRAFFYAGARSVLVSNWPVETTSARLLTTSIFELQSADPGLTRAEALRAAMLRLLDNADRRDANGRVLFTYAHPIFWAPFSLIGDSE